MRANDRSAENYDAGRRRFLVTAGWLTLAVPAAASTLVGCGSGEQTAEPKPAGGAPEPAPPATPPAEPMAPAEPAQGGGAAPPSADALVTEVAAAAAMVQALQYVNESAKADQRCTNCQLFTAKGEDRGACQLFPQGLVASGGWCASWAKKVDV